MARATITVTKNIFPRIAANFPQEAANATNKGVARMIEVADPLTPVEYGLLRGNKDIDVATPGDPSGGAHWLQDYAGHQNYGTSRGIVGKHFVDQGVEAGAATWMDALRSLEGRL